MSDRIDMPPPHLMVASGDLVTAWRAEVSTIRVLNAADFSPEAKAAHAPGTVAVLVVTEGEAGRRFDLGAEAAASLVRQLQSTLGNGR